MTNSITFAFWASHVLGNTDNKDSSIKIGTWYQLPPETDGGIGNTSGGGNIFTLDMLGKTNDELGIPEGNGDDVPYPLDGNYVLVEDIDLGNSVTEPIGVLTGSIDGQGFKISNTTITSGVIIGDRFVAGLFGMAENSGTIKNITIENINITVTYSGARNAYASPLVAYNDGIIENVRVLSGTINFTHNDSNGYWTHASGLVGENGIGGIIANSYSRANVNVTVGGNGTKNVVAGGLVGKNVSGAILNSYATGNISGTRVESGSNTTVMNLGGLVGHVHSYQGTAFVRNSFSIGNVSATIANSSRTVRLGKLTGHLESSPTMNANYYYNSSTLGISSGSYTTITSGDSNNNLSNFRSQTWMMSSSRNWNTAALTASHFPQNQNYQNPNPWSTAIWIYPGGSSYLDLKQDS